jgi:hypothetical protein
MTHPLDNIAHALFTRAIQTGRPGELLEHLFDGDSATIDATTSDIVYLPADELDDMIDASS